ncbi:hypothetical protein BD410DRAFT_704579, partial [Rickenella mellea]
AEHSRQDNDSLSGFIPQSTEPGGFVVEEDNASAGGFLVDDSSNAGGCIVDEGLDDVTSPPGYIPLSLIPTALQQLDLPPDDPEILEVFRNAASGWGATSSSSKGEQAVSREDWRSVCAVLLGADVDEAEALSQSDAYDVRGDDDDSDGGSEDEYMDEDDDMEGRESDDDYAPGPLKEKQISQSKGRRKRPRQSSPLTSASDDDHTPKVLTVRQKEECRRAFALFFPSVPDSDIDTQRIKIKDVATVAGVLKEKLTTEDIIEILEAFSSSKDKTVNLDDFGRMMVATKM